MTRAADAIGESFGRYHASYLAVTRRVRHRFAERDWAGVRRETVDRMRLQSEHVGQALGEVRTILGRAGVELEARETWRDLKAAYGRVVLGRDDVELTQTFFNSLTRRVFSHVGVDPQIDYVSEDIPLPYSGWEMASARMYAVRGVDAGVVRRVLRDAGLGVAFARLDEDAAAAAGRIEAGVVAALGTPELEALDFLRPVFYRNKGAYLVGRARRGEDKVPLVLAILHGAEGLVVDAVLPTEDEASIVFSFARWYFHVEVESPREVIGFLMSILPRKRIAELYISLGYLKHGKTEFYRDLMHQIARSDERFVVARGKRGLVMAVFTLPSYDWVFKLIKDRFPPQKSTTRWQVMEKYGRVLAQDRVGRMVDFQEFEHLPLPRERFSDALLAELLEVAGETVRAEGGEVVLDHVYVERRVTPLDVYLAEAAAEDAEAAVIDYGWCLKDLAAADVFPGDLLLKNFGVTRHGRVVFYDYDEFTSLAECTFRDFPESADPDHAMAPEPWFSVDEADVFPEELRRFLGLDGRLREVFEHHHADLFDVAFWHEMQERNRRGELIDFYPYAEERRLQPSGAVEPARSY
ncbi:MAG TPA: bifunctional isocitrate dehydrogenase kinase/phosphatase [Thermoanaerobaculia bacterium]|nr:bifunctional isocitrate dehydrogenase kinase/phosphatase [Thermoanaerobaculia bacterium]